MAEPGMPVFKFVSRRNEGKSVSLTAARIPNTGRDLAPLKEIANYENHEEGLTRIMTQFRNLMVEMEKGVKNLEG
jgi:hypothetical protein